MLGVHTGNLPAPFASFVGRQRQIVELRQLIDTHRLVTLTGAPGVGKTRLAVQVANQLAPQFVDGAWLVELAALDEAALVASAVARALGVRERDDPPVETVLDALRDRTVLLVLDNCEHLRDACASLTEMLLSNCPGVRILATSRQALGLTGEVVWRAPALSVPPGAGQASRGQAGPGEPGVGVAASPPGGATVKALLQSEAGLLFVERARAARPSFAVSADEASAIDEICRRVDGNPLAIELAAARIAHLAPRQIAERLDDRFRLLSRGRRSRVPHHDTLRSLLDWSHDLLSEAERVVFRRLSVFAGGWTLEAAEAVCGEGALDMLALLVDKSLVLVDEYPATLRYGFHETIWHYATEQLAASGEQAETRQRHARYFLALAEDAAPRLFGVELRPLLDVLDRDHDNLRIALRWASETANETASETASDIGPRLAGALWRFWQVRGYLREGRAWLERLLAAPMSAEPTPGQARALNAIGFLAFLQGDYLTALPYLTKSVQFWRDLGDRSGLVEALTNLGVLLRCLGHSAEARSALTEALALSRALGDLAWEGRAMNKLARLAYYEGDLIAARALHEAGIAAVRQAGNAWDIAIALGDLADVLQRLGDTAQAEQLYGESLRLWVELGDERGIAQALEGFALLTDPEQARANGDHVQLAVSVRLIAAARAVRERITEPNSPGRRVILERTLDTAQAALGEAFGSAWAAGSSAPLDRAVALALGDEAALADLTRADQEEAERPGRAAAQVVRPIHQAAPIAEIELSERERDVVALLARGLTNRQIAAELVVSERTVEWHVSNVLRRLGFSSRAQVALWAHERGRGRSE